MFETSLVDLIDLLFNLTILIFLVLIYRWCITEKSRADRLEESNRILTNRFIRFVLSLPLEYRIHLEDIESEKFDKQYPPRETEQPPVDK